MPSTRCSVTGAPATSGSSARIWLARLTSATSTSSIATMLTRSCTPSTVPRVIASMLEVAAWGTSFPSVTTASPGTMSTETAMAAGVLMIEAMRICPKASGTTLDRMLAYSAITVPATVAIPQLMRMKSSPRLMFRI